MRTYGDKLRDPQWQRKRLKIMERDGFKCKLCGDDKTTLNVHHLYYEKGADPWDYHDTSLVTVCESCHEELHASRFGQNILEALITGGANLSALYGVMCAFQFEFSEGPTAAPLPIERWDDVAEAITYALMAVARGVSGREIREALEGVRPE